MLGISRGDRAALSRHHLGHGAAHHRSEIRHHPHPVPGQRQCRSRSPQCRSSPRWSDSCAGNSPPIIWKPASMSFVRDGDLRYVGQGYELKIPFPDGDHRRRELDGGLDALSTRRTSANTAMSSRRTRSRSSTCASPAWAAMPKIAKLARAGRRDAWRRRRTQDRPMRVPRSTASCKPFETSFYRRASAAGRRDVRRAGHRAAEGQHHGHPAGLRRRSTTQPAI